MVQQCNLNYYLINLLLINSNKTGSEYLDKASINNNPNNSECVDNKVNADRVNERQVDDITPIKFNNIK